MIKTPVLIELKGGITCNGDLMKLDSYLNLFLEKTVTTTKNGRGFRESSYLFLRGENVKYVRFL